VEFELGVRRVVGAPPSARERLTEIVNARDPATTTAKARTADLRSQTGFGLRCSGPIAADPGVAAALPLQKLPTRRIPIGAQVTLDSGVLPTCGARCKAPICTATYHEQWVPNSGEAVGDQHKADLLT
jgi:hypothetical protein